MKIGILTFHCAHNYGAMLQAYALQKYVASLGFDVEIIDYRPEYLMQIYNLFSLKRFVSMSLFNKTRYLLTEPFGIYRKYKRYKKFDDFAKRYFKLSTTRYSKIVPFIADYQYIIFGSDQIWNPNITHGFDPVYIGDFKSNARFIAYAPSMETKELTQKQKEQCKKFLKNFFCISVREIKLKELLQPLTDKNIKLVCDPTFLLSQNQWNKLAKDAPIIHGKYVLVYQTRSNKKVIKIAKEIAKQRQCKLVQLSAIFYWQYKKNLKQCISPLEFINFIKFADCIVTTSYHGTAFSIIFNKNFYTIELGDNKDNRSASILHTLHLSDRLISNYKEFLNIDYQVPNIKLNQLKQVSEEYIQNSLRL